MKGHPHYCQALRKKEALLERAQQSPGRSLLSNLLEKICPKGIHDKSRASWQPRLVFLQLVCADLKKRLGCDGPIPTQHLLRVTRRRFLGGTAGTDVPSILSRPSQLP